MKFIIQPERFPADFMFQLNDTEFDNLKSQIMTSSCGGQREKEDE